MAVSEFWLEKLQVYGAVALLIGAAVIMIDFISDKMGIAGKKMPPQTLLMVMLCWPVAIGIFMAALYHEINRRR
jgi:hypothetical protein